MIQVVYLLIRLLPKTPHVILGLVRVSEKVLFVFHNLPSLLLLLLLHHADAVRSIEFVVARDFGGCDINNKR